MLMIASAVFCLIATGPTMVMAQQNDNGEQESYFNNPAQAAKAQNIAEAEVVQNDADVSDALSALNDAKATGDDNAIAEAQSAYDQAVAEAIASALEDGDIDTITADIEGMRADGMGWGQIAYEYGIHPSVLGLGNKFGYTHQVREKNMAAHGYGYGKKAGVISSTPRSLTGKAFGRSKSNKGKGANNAGGVGKANGKGNNAGGKGNNAGGKGNNGNHGNGNNGNGKGNN
jgi:hypothetical protein